MASRFSSSSNGDSAARRSSAAVPSAKRKANGRKRLVNYPRFGKSRPWRYIPSWKLILGSCATFALICIGGFAAAVAMTTIPDANSTASAEKTIVYWNDGTTEIGRIGDTNRVNVPLSQVPESVQHAVLAAEDRDFYEHGGFDPTSLARAAWTDLSTGANQGGSTITQQYAKNAFLTHDQTIDRKVRELLLSVKLETEVSKEQILENYLNTIYFGRGAYGIQAASQAYFGKDVSELSVNEAASLAAIIRAPGGYDPETHKDKLQARVNYVLDGMVTKGWLDQDKRAKIKLPAFKKYKQAKSSFVGTNAYLLDAVQREMSRKGFTEAEINAGGYRITTTFDKEDQAGAVEAVNNQGLGDEKGLRIGLTSVDTATGEVLAMYGGSDYAASQLSNADQAVGLAGSTFKTFALAAAFEDGIKLDSTWDGNSPRSFPGYPNLHNEGNQSYGQITLQQAIDNSVNTVFVDLAMKVGVEKVKEAAIRAGVPPETIGLGTADPTTVLGTASPTTESMASAYATFANGGMYIAPTTIKQISRNGSGPVYEYTPEPKRVFDEDVANSVAYALEDVVRNGTGYAAQGLGRPAAGKTGTTDNNKSAWFVGFTPQVSTAVMLVKSDKNGNAITLAGTGGGGSVHGGAYPAQIWTSYMRVASDGMEEKEFDDPGDMYKGDRYSSGGYYWQASPDPSKSASDKPRKPSPSVTAPTSPATQSAPPPTPSSPASATGTSGSSPKP